MTSRWIEGWTWRLPLYLSAAALVLCSWSEGFVHALALSRVNVPASPYVDPDSKPTDFVSTEPATSSIKEFIPLKYKKRYLKWKNEYLSTYVGSSQWRRYAWDPNFSLTITVSPKQGRGATVGQYQWDENGKLLAATITLGDKLDSGYPSSFKYPITCSLAPGNLPSEVRGTILAATKLAHEFGHLDLTISMDGRLCQLQNTLVLEYNRIFNSNGYDTSDPQLLELARKMNGTPVVIEQERESWAEMGSIIYLQERLRREPNFKMPEPIKQAIDAYYLTYPDRVW